MSFVVRRRVFAEESLLLCTQIGERFFAPLRMTNLFFRGVKSRDLQGLFMLCGALIGRLHRLNRQIRGFPGCDASGYLADVIEAAALQ